MSTTSQDSTNKSWCPDNGFCELEILVDKHLHLKKDAFGMSYVEISEGNKIILKFEYKRKASSDLSDSNYREEVFIILNPKELELETKDFKRVQVIFGRWCFCKGQAGNFRITKGSLLIKKINDYNYHLNLKFNLDEIPHEISGITHVFNLSM
ncbi:hypothetical protein E1J38_010630 [Seonamhaeicola sediminis]|uniref:Uncharacterized protein n=1 Tax=Seonamhaeicola sediminis TaxID=2528206 RepID=A0A562YCT1_9FLAO|nr:hypothetical protein E1J38_010630 [Seonamhaeicola sediminis]